MIRSLYDIYLEHLTIEEKQEMLENVRKRKRSEDRACKIFLVIIVALSIYFIWGAA